jgi:hypothetical protein
MTQRAVIDSVTVALDTILSDASHVGIGIFANLFVLGVVVTPPAVHGKGSLLFQSISMMAGFTFYIEFIRGCMGKMVEDHRTAIGFESDLLWFGGYFKIFGIVTELTAHRTLNMAIQAVFPDAPLVNRRIPAGLYQIFTVVAFPAIHFPGILSIGFHIVMTLLTGHILECGVIPVIKDDSSALGVESHPNRFPGLLENKTPECQEQKNQKYYPEDDFF